MKISYSTLDDIKEHASDVLQDGDFDFVRLDEFLTAAFDLGYDTGIDCAEDHEMGRECDDNS